VEAGANQPGEIARYRSIIEPSLTVITNVAAGHLEGFGSVDGVMEEKLALARDVGVAVVGTEPPALAVRARSAASRVVTAGLASADVTPDHLEVTADGRPILVVDGQRMVLPLLGRHQAANALLAWAVARELDLDPAAVAPAIEQCTIPGGRGELQQVGGMTILNDCYNANPASFRAAIDVARTLRAGRTLVFVAGTMRELGPDADELHRSIAAELVALEADTLAGVGAFVAPLEALRPRIAGRLLLAADAEGIGRALAPTLRGDEVVVLKASRGVALERILPVLTGLVQPTAESA
jgi:UDP-N-acetylmuramoyl-tripeptide--D-alanyl-D-alanine ligase